MKKKNVRRLLLLLLLVTFIGLNFVYAKEVTVTSGELHFCDYAGTRRAFLILGYILLIIKILVPILLMVVVIIDFSKVVFSGKTDDLSKTVSSSLKKLIAAFMVFITPSLINGLMTVLDHGEQGDMAGCYTCALDTSKCKVEENDDKDKKAQNIKTTVDEDTKNK